MPTDLKGWHRGEQLIHDKLDYRGSMATAFTWIENGMPDQHRLFHTTRLPFVPITTLDAEGRPWSSLVAGASGKPGFIQSPSDSELDMMLSTWPGDPLLENIKSFGKKNKTLVAGLGIEFSTRRRNKFAGWFTHYDKIDENHLHLRLRVNQAIGNCPKYINVRDLVSETQRSPKIVYNNTKLSFTDRLSDELVSLIQSSDTVFLGTSYSAAKEDENSFPSHVGMNQRGGLPGFIRVSQSDGRTVVLPDYSGNRLMTSLGNIEATPLASMSFTSFVTGDILYLTGTARTLIGAEAQKIMPRQNVVTTLYVTGYIFIRDALPVRQRPKTAVERSPYSPPVRVLAEEKVGEEIFDGVSVTLKSIEIHSPSLATFTFTASRAVQIKPGQVAILDFTDLLGKREYRHMAPGAEASLNDDLIRTWTVSSAHPDSEGTRTFSLTMRVKQGGVVTGALFAIAHQLSLRKPELLADATPLGLHIRLVGIGGEFTLTPRAKKHLWIAGGIGLTPFLSMLSSISASDDADQYDITLVLSTREPDVLLPLIRRTLPTSLSSKRSRITIHVFTDQRTQTADYPDGVAIRVHSGRIIPSFFSQMGSDAGERAVYLCGPVLFEEAGIDALKGAGLDTEEVIREKFGY